MAVFIVISAVFVSCIIRITTFITQVKHKEVTSIFQWLVEVVWIIFVLDVIWLIFGVFNFHPHCNHFLNLVVNVNPLLRYILDTFVIWNTLTCEVKIASRNVKPPFEIQSLVKDLKATFVDRMATFHQN